MLTYGQRLGTLDLPLGFTFLVVTTPSAPTLRGHLLGLRGALPPLGVEARLILATDELSKNIGSREPVAVSDSRKHPLLFFG
jgi:hypothetical protein